MRTSWASNGSAASDETMNLTVSPGAADSGSQYPTMSFAKALPSTLRVSVVVDRHARARRV